MGDRSWKPIERIEVSDTVYWFDHATGKTGVTNVTSVMAALSRPTRRLVFDDGSTLYVTDQHPLLQATKALSVNAGSLTSGDQLAALTHDNKITQRKIVSATPTGMTQTVYDLQVGAPGKFVVGLARVGAVRID
jgi:hypothetical protein